MSLPSKRGQSPYPNISIFLDAWSLSIFTPKSLTIVSCINNTTFISRQSKYFNLNMSHTIQSYKIPVCLNRTAVIFIQKQSDPYTTLVLREQTSAKIHKLGADSKMGSYRPVIHVHKYSWEWQKLQPAQIIHSSESEWLPSTSIMQNVSMCTNIQNHVTVCFTFSSLLKIIDASWQSHRSNSNSTQCSGSMLAAEEEMEENATEIRPKVLCWMKGKYKTSASNLAAVSLATWEALESYTRDICVLRCFSSLVIVSCT